MASGEAGRGILLPSPRAICSLLDAIDGIAYLTNRAGAMLAVGEPSWRKYACKNGANVELLRSSPAVPKHVEL